VRDAAGRAKLVVVVGRVLWRGGGKREEEGGASGMVKPRVDPAVNAIDAREVERNFIAKVVDYAAECVGVVVDLYV